MPTLKYNGNTDAYPAPWHLSPQDVANIDFRLERLNSHGISARLQAWAFGLRLPILRLFQWLDVRPRIGRLLIVTRDTDARAVLEDGARYPVHYNPEMRELGEGASFMLALNGAPHDFQRACLHSVHTPALDTLALDRTGASATDLLAGCSGRINVMKDYFCRASAEAAIAYLGLAIEDADSFADCTLAMSAMIFGDPLGSMESRELASHAAWRLRSIADRSIALARAGRASGVVQALASGSALSDGDIRANLLGLATALVPTNTLAAGNMLAYLQSDAEAWRQAVAAAVAGDDVRLKAVLLEAGRLRPALDPGLFRYMPVATTLPRGSRPRPGNSVVFVATAAALRDPERFDHPNRFDPDRIDKLTGRPFDGGLIFGHGEHHCSGKELAIDQIVILYRLLLRQPGLAAAPGAAGRLVSAGPFPRQLDMVFDTPARHGEQSMLKIAVPCPALGQGDAEAELVRDEIESLGNPVKVRALRRALDATDIVHFASINLIDAGMEQPVRHHLLIEVNVDGPPAGALAAATTALGPTLLGLLARCGYRSYWGHPLDRQTLADFLSYHRVRVQGWPWGATGLDFFGSLEHSLKTQARYAELAAFAASAVDLFRRAHGRGGKRAMETLRFVRAAIRQDSASWPTLRDAALQAQPGLASEFRLLEGQAAAHDFASALTMPSAERLKFADWQAKTVWEKLGETLLAPAMVKVLVISGVVALVLSALLLVLAGLAPPGFQVAGLIGFLARTVLAALVAVVLLGVVAVAIVLGLYRALRSHESSDRPDDRDPLYDRMAVIAGRENPPGFAQNHFLSVSRLKPGLFRRLSFAFALWGIEMYVRFWGRPGFIEDMGTIHFAGWFLLPGTDQMVFHSNFDGSWESYLEDFVTKAHLGQTAVWSNADGFPRARNLAQGGASDGDRFKRWVRGQQRATQFWYSRLPALTLASARTNAIIRTGLARAGSDTEARAWLATFGSQSAPQDTVETDEVQSIVFTSLPSHPFAACLMLSLPVADVERCAFFAELLDGTGDLPPLRFGDLVAESVLPPVLSYLGLSADGLAKCGLRGRGDADGLASFQFPFNAGMASRERVLGDHGKSVASDWRWHDRTTDAVLWLMATRAADRDAAVDAAEQRLSRLGGTVVRTIPTDPVGGTSINTGHFAFADGFSQPALRGCNAAATALARDVVAPGEFLFGYHNNQDCFAPSPRLRTELDPLDLLPDPSVDGSQRFPAFRPNGQPPAFRDFGRNGSYMVIRELQQDADRFRADNVAHASDLAARYPGLEAAPGVPISGDWVAAKQIGRWPDGTPLVRRAAPPPPGSTGPTPNDPINDFSYAREDPQGLRCPLGAHIRRGNPRDGLQPDDPDGAQITNRHRIIRRGRSYTVRNDDGEVETGLIFTAVCADLERQFEFVQQRWIVSPDFHGLGESDPLLSASDGLFTIPTLGGPVRLKGVNSYVTVRGGGYFFLPSRSALWFIRAGNDGRVISDVKDIAKPC